MVVNIGISSYCQGMGPRPASSRPPRADAGDEIAARLRAAGLAPTRRRRQVLAALGERRRPVSAHELYVELAGSGQRVGMSTVYRTLSALAATGLLHAFVADGETRYRPCHPGRHFHLVCRRCGDVLEHPADEGSGWLDHIAAAADFVPDPRPTELYGVCGTCRRTGDGSAGWHPHDLDAPVDDD
jgi:Fur family transcriptional regulator, ferric uptake regulator